MMVVKEELMTLGERSSVLYAPHDAPWDRAETAVSDRHLYGVGTR